jgi:Tfp pilus assembly major pilin PilA
MNKERGITLIALVITIIVLLIVAGITISMLTGENGILNKASKAKEEHLIEQYKEEINLIIIDEMAERKTENKEELMIVSLDTKIREKEWVNEIYKCNSSGEEQPTFEASTHLLVESKEHYEILIEVNEAKQTAKIVSLEKETEEKYVVTYHPNGGEGQEETIEIRQGVLLTLKECNYTKRAYQFLEWNTKEDGTGTKYEEGANINIEEDISLYAIWKPLVTPGEIVTGGNKEYSKNGIAVIPEGFCIVPGSDDVSEGLVISDDAGDSELNSSNIIANGNQFVWVPVTNMDNFKVIEGYYDNSLQDKVSSCSEPFTSGYSTEKEEYQAMRRGVEKSQGFYIGRYEAGKDSQGNLVVKKNSPVYSNVKWGTSMSNETGGAVVLAKNFKMNKTYKNSVTSTLIYGVQWDATMQFFDSNYLSSTCDENSYVRNSEGKGNHSGSLISTGSNENYKVKNIYDMDGNVWEWTMEAFGTKERVRRGGNYMNEASKYPVSFRNNNPPSNVLAQSGFRIALYV